MVKRLSEHLKFYAKDDYSIEEVIPLIEMNLRAATHSKLGISSYELVFGRSMPLGIPGNPETSSEENIDRVASDGTESTPWSIEKGERGFETDRKTNS